MKLELEAAVADELGRRPQRLQQISFWIFFHYQIVVAAAVAGFEVASQFVMRDTAISHLPPEANLMVRLAMAAAMPPIAEGHPCAQRLPCQSPKMSTSRQ